MSTSTVTIDASEWVYPDRYGVPHTVTTSQTFTFTTTDDTLISATAEYRLDIDETVTTDDGYTITMRPVDNPHGDNNFILTMSDAAQGTAVTNTNGSWRMSISVDETIQVWKCASLNIDDADSPGTISATFEDQFGNTFSWDTVTIVTA